MTTWPIDERDAGTRIDAWLASRSEIGSRPRARDWIERGKVFLNGEEVTFKRAGVPLQAGDTVAVWPDRPGSSRSQPRDLVAKRSALRVVFEDDALIVVDKPAGMLVEPLPGGRTEITLRELAADYLRSRRQRSGANADNALVVHRIDRDTTGLVLFATNERSQLALKRQFERRTAERVYLAVLSGRLAEREGTWTDLLMWDKVRLIQRPARAEQPGGGERSGRHGTRVRPARPTVAREAVARFRVVEQFDAAALVEVTLVTGKRNQVRVQAGLRGHPLVGERIYTKPARGARAPGLTDSVRFPRQALHAARLAFRHPVTGAPVVFTAPLPADLARLLDLLRRGPRTEVRGLRS